MTVVIMFALFGISMAIANVLDITMIVPLLVGLVLFAKKCIDMGYRPKQIAQMMMPGIKDSFVVIRILLIIGCLTGLWRMCGTIPFFVVKGIDLLPEKEFVLASFLLSSAVSYALGTSFGVTATCGTILIAIAKAGNANVVLTAGAILSGVYVGDRGSPSSSSANLVAITSKTDIRYNLRIMLKYSIVPYLLCVVIYYLLSCKYPMNGADKSILVTISCSYELHWVCVVPALIMIILPFCKVKIAISMLTSIIASILISIFVQEQPLLDVLLTMLRGFKPSDDSIAQILSGGGITSMLEVCFILIISGTYGGIFDETKMLSGINELLMRMKAKIGRFPVMAILGFAVSAVFCNQTIGIIMQGQLASKLYDDSYKEKEQKMIDMEDSVVTIAGLVPWCIASSVPLEMMESNYKSLIYAFYLYLIPISHIVTQKLMKKKETKQY